MRHTDDDQRRAAQIATWAPRAGSGLVVMREKDKREGAPSLFSLVAAELTRRGTASSVAWLRTPDGINPSLAHVAIHVTELNEANIVIAVDYARAIILKNPAVPLGTAPKVLVRGSTTVRGPAEISLLEDEPQRWVLEKPRRISEGVETPRVDPPSIVVSGFSYAHPPGALDPYPVGHAPGEAQAFSRIMASMATPLDPRDPTPAQHDPGAARATMDRALASNLVHCPHGLRGACRIC